MFIMVSLHDYAYTVFFKAGLNYSAELSRTKKHAVWEACFVRFLTMTVSILLPLKQKCYSAEELTVEPDDKVMSTLTVVSEM